MSAKNYEFLWEILREYNFTINELDHADYICVLCQKLLIEAKQAPCACRFCAKCIEEYLSKGNSICPGNKSDCTDEILQLNENISNDYVTNRKISKLKLKCPSENCTYEDILSNMNQHLMLCGKPSVACPFSQFGCNQICDDKEEIVKHLQLENYEHSHLMMEMIVNLKNEVEILTKENNSLKSVSHQQQLQIEKIEVIINKMQNTNLTSESSLSCNVEQFSQELNTTEFQESIFNLEDNVNTQITEPFISNSYVDIQKGESINLDEIEYIEEDFSSVFSLDNETNDLYHYKEYIWKFRNFSKITKMKKSVDSEEFFTHVKGYKMQLRLVPHIWYRSRESGVLIFLNCIKGLYDRYLQWPLNCTVKIGIINEVSGQFLLKQSKTIQYYTSDKYPVQPFLFILSNNRICFQDDNLLVKCVMKVFK